MGAKSRQAASCTEEERSKCGSPDDIDRPLTDSGPREENAALQSIILIMEGNCRQVGGRGDGLEQGWL